MKVLTIYDKDLDYYGNWLVGNAAKEFIDGKYTHVQRLGKKLYMGKRFPAQTVGGEDMVMVSEYVGPAT